jgi:hypothetical protein
MLALQGSTTTAGTTGRPGPGDGPVPSMLVPLINDDLVRWKDTDKVSLADTDAAYSALPPYARSRFFLSSGVLYKSKSRCVYRRDEVTAWALLQLVERYPNLPDFDVVLNCRDGPLLRRTRNKPGPLVLAYSATGVNAEVAFPDYTLWGLPGKIKPWAQLRLDLLHRAQTPFTRKLPKLIATGVINDYHSSLGVHARQAVAMCQSRKAATHTGSEINGTASLASRLASGAAGTAYGSSGTGTGGAGAPLWSRLDIRYHSLYFERFYSTEEHCAFRYILLSPGSHAVWLDHMKQKLLCGSLVLLLEPPGVSRERFQYDVLTRLLVPGVHYVSVPMPDLDPRLPPTQRAWAQQQVCERLAATLDWADANPRAAESIARAGKALVRDALTMDAVYAYMAAVLRKAGSLLRYDPREAMAAHRLIGTDPKRLAPFNASNITRVPRDPEEFVKALRNDTFVYPKSAQIREADWAAVVLDFNYSTMGQEFATSAKALQQEVLELRRKSQREEEARREAERAERQARKAQRRRRGRGSARSGGARGRGARSRWT